MHNFLLTLFIIRSLFNDAVPNVKLRGVERDEKTNMCGGHERKMLHSSHVFVFEKGPTADATDAPQP
jgi:hypothetical protein